MSFLSLFLCNFHSIEAACTAHPTADVFINFASFRRQIFIYHLLFYLFSNSVCNDHIFLLCSAAASSMTALKQPTIRVVAIIAEGVPESDAKQLIAYARANNKVREIPRIVHEFVLPVSF